MKSKNTAKKFVAKDDINIFYWVTWKNGMKDKFILLYPGSALNHTSLEEIEKGLNELGYPTINFDPRGSGYSDAPIPREYYELEKVTGDLEGIISKESLEKPIFIGHSYGFMPSVDYAVKTENSSKIIGIGASHNFKETAPNKLAFHIFDKGIIYLDYLLSLGTFISHKLTDTKRSECPNQNLREASGYEIWLSIADVPLKVAASHVIGQREITTWDISKKLSQLKTPLVLIYGDKDFMVNYSAGQKIKELVTVDCDIEIIKNANHSLPIKYPEKVLKILEKYI